MDLRDFLGRQYEQDTDVEAGVFTINEEKASEKIRDALRHEPQNFVLAIWMATFAGETNLTVRTRGPFLTRYLLFPPSIEFQCIGLPPVELPDLDKALVGSEDSLPTLFARAFCQAQELLPSKLVIESWHGGALERLTWKKGKTTHSTSKQNTSKFEGVRFLFWEGKNAARGAVDALCRVAQWSPRQLKVNDRHRDFEPDNSSLLGSRYWRFPGLPIVSEKLEPDTKCWGEYSLYAYVEDKRRGSTFIALVNGLCLPLPPMPYFSEEPFDLPGLTLVIRWPEFRLDASGASLVRNFDSPPWLGAVQSMVKELRRVVLENEESRYYTLRNWHCLNPGHLTERPLFALKAGGYKSYSQLKYSDIDFGEALKAPDARYAESLVPPPAPYKFTSGYEFPKHSLLSTDGRWAAFLSSDRCQIVDLEWRDKEVQWLDFSPSILGDDAAWHPHQPWLVIRREFGFVVWDARARSVVFQTGLLNALAPAFSTDGRSLQVTQHRNLKFMIHRWSVESWKKELSEWVLEGVPRVTGDYQLEFLLDKIRLSYYETPTNTLAEFSFESTVPYTLCDVSPDGLKVALTDQKMLYLLELSERCVSEVGECSGLAVFSWNSDFLLFHDGVNCRAYDISQQRLRGQIAHYTCASRCGTAFRFPFIPRSVNFPKYRTEALISPLQPPPNGVAHRTLYLLSGDDAYTAISLEAEDEFRFVWDYSGGKFALTEEYLALEGPFGVSLFDLKKQALRFENDSHLCGRAIVHWKGVLDPRTLEVAAEAHLHDQQPSTEAYSQYQICKTRIGKEISVDLLTGAVEESPLSSTVARNKEQWVAQDEKGWSYVLVSDGKQRRTLPDAKSLCIGSKNPWFVRANEHTTELLAQFKSGGRHMAYVDGTDPQISPTGGYIAVYRNQTIVVCDDQLYKHGILNCGHCTFDEWNWLTDRAIRVGDSIWVADWKRGWKNPWLLEAKFPSFMQTHNGSNIGLAQEGGQVHFYCLSTGKKLGVLHSLRGYYFFFTPDGHWEAFPEHALDEVDPKPVKPPTPGLLYSVFKPKRG